MNDSSPQLRIFAERLISHEEGSGRSTRSLLAPAIPVIDKLRPHLATLMGKSGYRGLVSRALALASKEVAGMSAWRVNDKGMIEELETGGPKSHPEALDTGKAALVARMLGLLMAFIGEILTCQMVREIWPDFPQGEDFKTEV